MLLEEILDDNDCGDNVGDYCHTENDINRSRKLGVMGLQLHRKYLITMNMIMIFTMTIPTRIN